MLWPRIAELSLLGALGCGSFLLELVEKELSKEDCQYHYIVLQSTENSVPFYEKKGFVRVGAVARYSSPENREKDDGEDENSDGKRKRKRSSQNNKHNQKKKKSKPVLFVSQVFSSKVGATKTKDQEGMAKVLKRTWQTSGFQLREYLFCFNANTV